MVSELIRERLVKYKSDVISILAREDLKDFEYNTLQKFYLLIERALLDKIDEKRYNADTIVKARTMEFGIILSATKNNKVKNLVKEMNLGIL